MKVGSLVKVTHILTNGHAGLVLRSYTLKSEDTLCAKVFMVTGPYKGEQFPFYQKQLEVISESR